MYDFESNRKFAVPEKIFKRPATTIEARLSQLGFEMNTSPFSIGFNNRYTGKRIVSTANRKLVVSEKFSEIGFTLPTQRVFGLGQHNAQFKLTNGTYSLYARGR